MRKYFLVMIMCVLVVAGCGRQEKTAIAIGDIKVTASQFDRDFEASRFSFQKEAGRKRFLDNYISKKLILREAEGMGLDKDPEFLRDIQTFWEQGLLKRVLDKKAKEFSIRAKVTDEEVKEYYNENKEKRFIGKDLATVYDQVKWVLLKNKQTRAMTDWVESLRGKTAVSIDYDSLGIKDSTKGKK